jgi:tRNA threonylcarbamoyl adenosine modification protein YeaZ
MNYLAIDTSGRNLTVLICNNGKMSVYHDDSCGVNHSVELMPKIEELAIKSGFDLKGADFFACVVGAGSFTGIRIGVATVKAMCFAFNKPCLSITSFDTIAYNSQGGKVLAVIDAKHNGFYVCGYDGRAISVEPSYVMRESLTEYVNEYELLSFEPIKDLPVTVVSIAKGLEKAISEKANEISSDLETLSPLYVRKSQAEEGRK